jgi:hypothetical protein
MISGFGYKNGVTVWIDPEEDGFTIFSSDEKLRRRIPEEWGKIEDIFKDGECLKVRTVNGVFPLNE